MSNGKKSKEDFSLTALKSGDRAEFARLVDTYSDVVYRLGMKMLNNAQDAEDILQETFIKVYKNISGFDGRSSLSTWIYRIATNEALMLIRRRKHIEVSIDYPINNTKQDSESMQIVDFCCLPEVELMTEEARTYMDQAVAELPLNLRVVFLLRDIEGLSTRETSEVLDISETAVKTRLSRARMRLRQKLSLYYNERFGSQIKEKGRLSAGELM